jgi:hypothetical protein
LLFGSPLKRNEQKCHVWEVDDGEQHWYSAYNAEHAVKQHAEPLCEKDLKDNPPSKWTAKKLPDNEKLPVWSDYEGDPTVKLAAEWAENGPGPIATTAW